MDDPKRLGLAYRKPPKGGKDLWELPVRRRLIGTEYRPTDRLACVIIVASTILMLVVGFAAIGGDALTFAIVCGSVFPGVAFMIARMMKTPEWHRVVALIYFLLCCVMGFLFAQSGWFAH